MPSARRQKSKAKPALRRAAPARKPAAKKSSGASARKPPTAKAAPKSSHSGASKSPAKASSPSAAVMPVVRRADGRAHVLSLSFVREGDEFLARMETDSGQITELKNRSLDQLLTLVASELEDLLE
jgi:hypothetical protein